MTTIGTPAVVGGELIEASWGNSVRADLQGLNADKLERAGTPGMTGDLDMNNHRVTGLQDPSADGHATSRKYVNDRYATISGQDFTGDVKAPTLRSNAGAAIGSNASFPGNGTFGTGLTVTAGNVLVPGGFVRTGLDPLSGAGLEIASSGKISTAVAAGDGTMVNLRRGGAPSVGENFLRFMTGAAPGTQVGSIAVAAGGTTNYGTTSDYRLKRERGVLGGDDVIERLRQLRPIRFEWIGNRKAGTFDGFLAHEVAEVVPGAVVGEVDATDDEGGVVPQQLDSSRIVPLLVAALQQALDRIEVLEGQR